MIDYFTGRIPIHCFSDSFNRMTGPRQASWHFGIQSGSPIWLEEIQLFKQSYAKSLGLLWQKVWFRSRTGHWTQAYKTKDLTGILNPRPNASSCTYTLTLDYKNVLKTYICWKIKKYCILWKYLESNISFMHGKCRS